MTLQTYRFPPSPFVSLRSSGLRLPRNLTIARGSPGGAEVLDIHPVLSPETSLISFPAQRYFAVMSAKPLIPMLVVIISLLSAISAAYPSTPLKTGLKARDYPVFPAQPPSCPICVENYDNIDSCAQAAPVLANVSTVS